MKANLKYSKKRLSEGSSSYTSDFKDFVERVDEVSTEDGLRKLYDEVNEYGFNMSDLHYLTYLIFKKMKSLEESLNEDLFDKPRNIADSICKYLDSKNFYNYELVDYDAYPMNTSKITFEVDGDWKHDHWRFKDLVYDWSFDNNKSIYKMESELVRDDGSDSYASDYFIYVTENEDSLNTLKSMSKLFSEEYEDDVDNNLEKEEESLSEPSSKNIISNIESKLFSIIKKYFHDDNYSHTQGIKITESNYDLLRYTARPYSGYRGTSSKLIMDDDGHSMSEFKSEVRKYLKQFGVTKIKFDTKKLKLHYGYVSGPDDFPVICLNAIYFNDINNNVDESLNEASNKSFSYIRNNPQDYILDLVEEDSVDQYDVIFSLLRHIDKESCLKVINELNLSSKSSTTWGIINNNSGKFLKQNYIDNPGESYHDYDFSILSNDTGVFDNIDKANDFIDKYLNGDYDTFGTKLLNSYQDGYKEIRTESLNEASYGGAFDIEDDMYFTKEELVEFAGDIAEEFSKLTGHMNCDVDNVYMENDPLALNVDIYDPKDDVSHSAYTRIDMRKIRKPSDIYRYMDRILKQLEDSFHEYHENDFEDAD